MNASETFVSDSAQESLIPEIKEPWFLTMAYESFYDGNVYSMEPTYGNFLGYRIPAGRLGAPTSIQTANQLKEVSDRINAGVRSVESQSISPEVFDQIPKQHLKEINRMANMTGVTMSIHAPLIDPAGFEKEGWSEQNREQAERQLSEVINKSVEMTGGNSPVVIHSSNFPGTEYIPGKEGPEISGLVVINQENPREMTRLEKSEMVTPESVAEGRGSEILTPEDRLRMLNSTNFRNKITQLSFYKKEADEVIGNSVTSLVIPFEKLDRGEKISPEDINPEQLNAISNISRANRFLGSIQTSFQNSFDEAYRFGNEEQKEKLKELAKSWQKEEKEFGNLIKNAGDLNDDRVRGAVSSILTIKKAQLLDNSINQIGQIFEHEGPQIYKPVEEFAMGKASETIANVAFNAYVRHRDKAPIIAMENLYPGLAFSKSDDLKKLVDEAREKFIINATQKGFGKEEAAKQAEKMIGVTWDVGHLNMLRKQGFKEEDIIKETQRIAKYVKHVHLTDNFGYSDSHLPPGMGNVPFKQIMEELEKKGFKGKGIVEAGGFVQHFKVNPHPYVLEAMGSPIYAAMQAPYWNQGREITGNYFGGYGPFLPEKHFSIYGSGFSGLPTELGGQVQGGRMSGTPME